MKMIKTLAALAVVCIFAGCSSHAVYINKEEGYRDNDNLLKLLNSPPVDVHEQRGLKPVKLIIKQQPKAPAASTVPAVPLEKVVTIYPADGQPYQLFDQADWNELKPFFPDLKKEVQKSLNGRTAYKLILFQIMPFGFDQAGMTDKSLKEQVAKAVTVIRSQGLKPFLVMGYADPKGPAAHNQPLSSKRAEAVADELESFGIAAVRVVPKGETNQFAPDAATKTQHGPNRTVWLVCFDK